MQNEMIAGFLTNEACTLRVPGTATGKFATFMGSRPTAPSDGVRYSVHSCQGMSCSISPISGEYSASNMTGPGAAELRATWPDGTYIGQLFTVNFLGAAEARP